MHRSVLRLCMLVLLLAGTWTSGDPTGNDRVARVCEALANSPEDGSLLEMLKPLVVSDHPDAKSGRLAVLYGLGLMCAGNDELAARVKRHVLRSFPDSAYQKHLGDAYTCGDCPKCRGTRVIKSACKNCGGTGHCGTCRGRGKIMMTGLGGSKRAAQRGVNCAKCQGSGQCTACKGTKRRSAPCYHCGGRGRVTNRDRVKHVYLAMLRGEDVPPASEVPHGARAATDTKLPADDVRPRWDQLPPEEKAKLNARWLAVRLVVPGQGIPAGRVLEHADGRTEKIPFPTIKVPEANPRNPDGVVGCIMQASQVTTGSGGIPSVWKRDVRGKKVIYGLSVAAHVPIFPRDKTGIQLATELGVRHQLVKFDFDDKATRAWGDDVISYLEAGHLRPPCPYRLPGEAMAGSLPRELARFAKTGRKW
jgi:hypothetical protein